MTTAKLIYGLFGGVLIISGGIWWGLTLHFAYTRIDEALSHLIHCRAVQDKALSRGRGPWGMMLLVGAIASFVCFPNYYHKRGEINPQELEVLPDSLRRRLKIMHWMNLVLASVAILYGVVGWIGVIE